MNDVPHRKPSYRYCLDPVFLSAVTLYFVNRWILEPCSTGYTVVFHWYFNDLICIPFWLPVSLYVQRRLGIRTHDGFPTLREVVGHLVLWSFVFEVLGPRYYMQATGDPVDVVAYACGAAGAALVWRKIGGRTTHDALASPEQAI